MAARQIGGNTDLTVMDESVTVRIKQEPNNEPSHDCDDTTDVGQLVQPVNCAGVTLRSSLKKTTLSPVVSCQQKQPPPQLQQQPSLEQLKTMAAEMNAILIKLTGDLNNGQNEKQMLRQELERAQLSLESLKQMKKQIKEAGTSPADKTIETALVNGHVSYNTANSTNKITEKMFRQDVSLAVIGPVVLQHIVMPSRPQVTLSRLTERHFIEKYEKPRYKPDCKVCKAAGKRRQTCLYCPDCNTPLCLTPCFKLYHTVEDYQPSRQRHLQSSTASTPVNEGSSSDFT